ncbi:MAG: transcriptional repressor [Spirochaetes bacterium]|nr:transcriptional repressor [Spirochaetota bacterium]
MNNSDIKNILTEKGIKPSLHRMKVLEYLISNRNHPTVDSIYKDISSEIPTLSKTTVYNTLKTFLEYKVVQAVTIEDNEVRYDVETESHAHFKCTKCGKLYDIELDAKVLNLKSVSGHAVRESHLYFKGICKSCQ